MDDLLPKLLTFPPHPPPRNPLSDASYDEGIKSQITAMRKLSEKQLLQQTSSGESSLSVINPALNTVPYTFILLAHVSAFQKGSKVIKLEVLWEKITGYLESFDARQVRYVGAEFSNVVDAAAALARHNGQHALAIAPIRDAILRLDPSGSVLTTPHLYLAKVALETRSLDAVVPVIEKFILYLPVAKEQQAKPKYLCDLSLAPAQYITVSNNLNGKMKPVDIMEYYFHCGMIFIGLRKWEDALEVLESAVTYPAKDGAVSKVMVEAYKKWVLVGVMLQGKALPLPKTTTPTAAKAFHAIGKPYEAIAQIFETGTAARLKAEFEHGQGAWHQDCNTGLFLELLKEFQKFQIRNLGNVYGKISISEIHNQTMSAETGAKLPSSQAVESLVRSMINDGSLNATLSNAPGQAAVLTFVTGGPVLSEGQMAAELEAASQRVRILTENIKQTDRMFTHEKDYVTFAKKMKAKTGKLNMNDQGIGGEMEWNAMEDEELMTGVF